MYKAYKGSIVVDALETLQCVRYFTGIGVTRCGVGDAPQGIISSDGGQIYHVEGWPEFPEGDYETVRLLEIDTDEYYEIREALDSGLGVPVDPETPEQETPKTQAQILQEQIDAVGRQVQQMAGFAGSPEADFIASKNYVKGEFVVIKSTIYSVTANIARGSRITPYLNVTATSLAEIFNSKETHHV